MATSVIDQFARALCEHGLNPGDTPIIADGGIHRFRGPDDGFGKRNAWYVLHANGRSAGAFGNWRTGARFTWRADATNRLSKRERSQRLEDQTLREQTAHKDRERCMARAKRLWETAMPADARHPYLVRKAVEPHGLRQLGNLLVIPLFSAGEIVGLQFIAANGDKRFMRGTAPAGAYFAIGKPTGPVLICEGFATGASLRAATGHFVAVAFSAGNLLAVARALRENFSDARLILCADDDAATPGNPGITKATEAAVAVSGSLAIPHFGSTRSTGTTDFNDQERRCGRGAVERAVAAAKPPEICASRQAPHNVPANNPENLLDTVARLGSLDPLQYEQVREIEAHRLGVRVGVLDKAVSTARRTRQEEGGKAAMFPIIEPWPEPVNGAEILNALRDTVRQFIVCEREIAITVALWCAFTWFMDRVHVAPLAVITAPEPRCGKSQLLDLIGRLSRRPLVASNISPSAVFRVIEAHSPTLLIDEADSFFKDNDELRGVINSGHTRQSAYVIRTVGDDFEPRQFSTWGAKAISGIGHLSPTLMDRAVTLELRRKLPSETVRRLRHAEPGLFDGLASKLARFAEDAGPAIECARPELPDPLNDRAQDNWEPLLAIADHAGGEWPELGRRAALRLSCDTETTQSTGVELLADIQWVFDAKRVDRISSAELIEALCSDDEKPWVTYARGKPISPKQLATRLKQYGIVSKTLRIGYETPKGYERGQFADTFSRYLAQHATPPVSATPPHANIHNVPSVADDPQRCGKEFASATRKSAPTLECGGVADENVRSGRIVEVEI